MSKAFALAGWAEKAHVRPNRCGVCNAGEEVVEVIRQFLQLRVEGKTQANWAVFHRDILQGKFGIETSAATTRRHGRFCEKELFYKAYPNNG